MTVWVLVAVMAAAFMHATWNALIKLGTSKLTSMLILTVVQGGFGLIIALTRPMPDPHVWLWLLASGVFHSAYKLFLAYAYEQGDLSRVYPIARGTAPMVVLVISALFLADKIAGWEYVGIIILGLGILLMARGVFSSGESRKLLPFALGSAMATAGYSIVDGLGAREAGDAVAYVGWLFALDAVFFTPCCLALRGRSVLQANRKAWIMGSIAAVFSYGAYAIAVWAMTVAPIALVAALRETSILFAVLIGAVAFGEKMNLQKGIAAALIVAGVIVTRF
ncbi:MAG: EamA family transporter [Loktanella sp.]|jgi:drug/metabolite transporter (DMT)-like permease|nr:EamA family transporter [Loktanella sp.]MDO7607522.1 EamA family transporter [Loktanella sp.]MDO7622566.1 EamA family transporter [Loktanella sp.]MDO7626239.1 EamA family transporter [Loktanella sp.]MDO7632024.1 EamA family transporter [Loktanella sp.]